MALPRRRAGALLLVAALALAATVFSSAGAAQAPKVLEAHQEAATAGRARAPTGSDAAVTVTIEQHVVVVDKRGGGGGHGGGHGGGEGGGGHGGGQGTGGGHGDGEGEGEGEGSRGFRGAGCHGYGTSRGPKSSASSGHDGVWKVGVAASVLGAAAWLL